MIYNQAFFSMVLFSTAMNAEVSAGNKDQGLLDESGHHRFGSQRQQCVYKCSNESANRQEILEILRPTSYICNESGMNPMLILNNVQNASAKACTLKPPFDCTFGHNFIRNTECYREVYDQDLDDCESRDKCLPYKTAVKNQRLEDLREWPSVLGNTSFVAINVVPKKL
uniref:Uncharacterized protein n=1 Tax=Romanomermis culicivorax TaxID=13658 RepID=A0A915HJJ4_ROMCU